MAARRSQGDATVTTVTTTTEPPTACRAREETYSQMESNGKKRISPETASRGVHQFNRGQMSGPRQMVVVIPAPQGGAK